MDFEFTDDQVSLRDAVARWVDKGFSFERRHGIAKKGGHTRDVYGELAELGLTEWVAGLPGGLDTVLGPGGTSLSAGEEQLVAFARLLVRDVSVVVLDEATARMDPVTEARVTRIGWSGPAVTSSSTWVTKVRVRARPAPSALKSTATKGASSTVIPTFSTGVTRK